jgi:hypothetical protein
MFLSSGARGQGPTVSSPPGQIYFLDGTVHTQRDGRQQLRLHLVNNKLSSLLVFHKGTVVRRLLARVLLVLSMLRDKRFSEMNYFARKSNMFNIFLLHMSVKLSYESFQIS